MSDNIIGTFGAGDQVAAVMLDSWLNEGREFTARMTATEVALLYLRMTEASYGRVRKLGFMHADLHHAVALSGPVNSALSAHHDSLSYYALITPCDVYRIVDAIEDLTDEDAGVLAYQMAAPGTQGTDAEKARAFSFLPQRYVTSVLDQHNVITKKPNTQAINERIGTLAAAIARIVDEVAEIEVGAGQKIKVTQTHPTAGHTVDKRTYDGDLPEASVIALSECAITQYLTTIQGGSGYPSDAVIFTVKHNLSGREIVLKSGDNTLKKRVTRGTPLAMYGHDLSKSWYLTIEESG